jgi:hypothetical protein
LHITCWEGRAGGLFYWSGARTREWGASMYAVCGQVCLCSSNRLQAVADARGLGVLLCWELCRAQQGSAMTHAAGSMLKQSCRLLLLLRAAVCGSDAAVSWLLLNV